MASLASTTSTDRTYAGSSAAASAVVAPPRRKVVPLLDAMPYLNASERAACPCVCRVWRAAILNPSAIPEILRHLNEVIIPRLLAAYKRSVANAVATPHRGALPEPSSVVKVDSESGRSQVVQETLAAAGAPTANPAAIFRPVASSQSSSGPVVRAFPAAAGVESSSL